MSVTSNYGQETSIQYKDGLYILWGDTFSSMLVYTTFKLMMNTYIEEKKFVCMLYTFISKIGTQTQPIWPKA